jgi:MFS family permease
VAASLPEARPYPPASPPEALPFPPAAKAWYATAILAFMFWMSVLDRFIISLLVVPLRRDMGISDTQFALLNGTAFIVTFALLGTVAGVLADRYSRRTIIFAGVAVWSLATAACGVTQNFGQLFLARIGVGAGEACLNPCATSMIADYFPRERLTLATAIYAIGGTAGAGMAFLVGGSIIALVTQHDFFAIPLLGDVRSWQAVFIIIGVPGMVLSALIFTISDPERRGKSNLMPAGLSWRATYGALWKFMGGRWRFFFWHYLGFTFASTVVVGCVGWYPAHMGRSFHMGTGRIGLTLGLTIIIFGILGKVLCGRAVDALYRRGHRDAQLRWYAGCLLAAVPVGVIGTTSGNPAVFLAGIGIMVMLLQPLPACAYASMNLITPNELRGAGVAAFNVFPGLIGSITGPLLIAAIGQHFFAGPTGIGLGMAVVIAICCPLGAASLALGCRPMRDAVREAQTSMPELNEIPGSRQLAAHRR